MKVVNKVEFFKLPKGTVYAEFSPYILSGLYIKDETIYNEGVPSDFTYQSLLGNVECTDSINFVDILAKSQEDGTSFNLDFDCIERDGTYTDDDYYAIYEEEDIQGLIKSLSNSLKK